MGKINNYPYSNMVHQNVNWIVDKVKEASEKAEHAEQTVQEMDSRIEQVEENKIDKVTEPYRLYGTDGNGEQTSRALDFFHNFQPQSIPVRAVNGAIRTPAPTLDNEAANKKYVDDAVSGVGDNKVDKTGEANKIYGTDSHGEQVVYSAASSVSSETVVVRTVDGRIKSSTPVDDVDVANKEYVDRQDAKREAKWITVVDDVIYTSLDTNTKTYDLRCGDPALAGCDELRIYTVVDNGDIEPELYNSTDLDISVNNDFFFSVKGGVPQSSTQRREQEGLDMHSWDWSSFGFGDINYVVLSGEIFSDKGAFQRANVSIASSLDNTTYNYEYDPAEDTPSVDTPGFRGYPIKFENEYGATVTGTYLTVVYDSAPGVQPGQIIIESFTQGSIAQFSAGVWYYNKVFVEHKIATGTFDMKFINSEMAETETAGSGNRNNIDEGHIIPMANVNRYAMHPANNIIDYVTIRVSNGVIREGTRVIIKYKGEVLKQDE